jgi:hypothetical protein
MENEMTRRSRNKTNKRSPHASSPSKPRTAAELPADASPDALAASAAYALADPAGDDPVPDDIDVFRLALARQMMTFLGMPRRCREPLCRRSQSCAGEDMRCLRDFPAPQLSEARRANLRAEMRRALERRMAEIEAGGEAQ